MLLPESDYFNPAAKFSFIAAILFHRPTVMVCYGPTGTLKVGHKT